MIAQNEINVQGELGNKTDNCSLIKASYRKYFSTNFIMMPVQLLHT